MSPVASTSSWHPAIFGTWTNGKIFTGDIPDAPEKVFHFGPTRLWSKPVHKNRYGTKDHIFLAEALTRACQTSWILGYS